MRFSMSDPILHQEEWSVHITPAGLLAGVVAFCLFLFLWIAVCHGYAVGLSADISAASVSLTWICVCTHIITDPYEFVNN